MKGFVLHLVLVVFYKIFRIIRIKYKISALGGPGYENIFHRFYGIRQDTLG
jgi:hypothetical protein